MRNFSKLFALLLVLILLLQSTVISVFAVDYSYESTYSTSTQPTSYSTKYNSGTRGVLATTLDGTSASSYYSDGYDFETLSVLSSSTLLSSLRTLMKSTHKKNSTYDDCKNMAKYTDCQNEDGTVVLFYTSFVTTSSTFNASSPGWNREHVWPKSLGGYNTTGPGADLHHIRPDNVKTNSTRGNKKYGNVTNGSQAYGDTLVNSMSGGTYNTTYFEPFDDVKGDVARICLYMYVRYGADWNGCSSITNIFQSIDVLLEWCELDPVDTWELGRNEVVAAYQGNRNVFIDYPEYAWLIFGKDVPEDMTTPSSKASEGIEGNGGGSNGDSNNGGNNGSDGNTTTTPEVVTSPVAGTSYKLGMNQTLAGGTYYLAGGMDTKNSFYLATTDDFSSAIDIYLEETTDGYYIYTLADGTKTYINSKEVTGSDGNLHVNGIYSTTAETVYTFDTELNTLVTKISGKTYALGTRNDKSYTTVGPCDVSNDPFVCQFYTNNSGNSGTDTPDIPDTPASGYKSTFTNAVSALKGLEGEALYSKICEAVNAYAKLTDDEKNSVQNEYASLLSVVEKYNNDIDNITNDTLDIRVLATSVEALALYALPFAVYQLFGKKYI